MRFGPKRGHVLYIFENFFKDFSLALIAAVIGVIQGDMDFLLNNVGVLVVVLFGPISRIVRYLTTFYSVDNEKLVIKTGLFNKSFMEIPVATVTTVDLSQGVLHQILGVYRLNVDNAGNMSSAGKKVRMTLSAQDAFMVRELLIQGRNGLDGFNFAAEEKNSERFKAAVSVEQSVTEEKLNQRNGKQIRVKPSQLVLMGLMKSKMTFFFQLIALIMTITAVFNISSERLSETASEVVVVMGIGFVATAAIAVVFLLAAVCGAAGALIRYYDFTVLDNGEAVKIQYGLFTKKGYVIQKNRISGFRYEQSFLMRLCGCGILQIFAIGYGSDGDSESSEEPILFPLISKNELSGVMSEILPEIKSEQEYVKPPKGSLHYFFCGFGFVFALAVLAVSVYFTATRPLCRHLWVVGVLPLLYSVLGRVMEYRNTGIYCCRDHISLSAGGFQKKTVFIKNAHVERVTAFGSKWKEKKGIVGLAVGCIAPASSANQKVKNVPLFCLKQVAEKMIY